jgi:peptide/nickel transport system substrate-binding protein
MKRLLSILLVALLLLPAFTGLTESNTGFFELTESGALVYDNAKTFDSYKQSPMLDGKGLPPVEDRLPKIPKIANGIIPTNVEFSVGQYGGTLRTVCANAEWNPNTWAMNNEPLLNTPGILGDTITGNVLLGYEMSEDEREFTFFMREGMKWSDGVPITTEDVAFTINDFWLNKDLNSSPPTWFFSSTGTPLTFEVIDDYTFKFIFDVANGGFPVTISIKNWIGHSDFIKPKHYLVNFHKDFADAATLAANCAKYNYDVADWVAMFQDVDITNWECNQPKAIGFPTVEPWMIVSANETLTVFERNPYYFKVDAEGNQLPYIDYLYSEHLQNTESVNLKLISGEVDYNVFETALTNMPLYLQNAEKNGYKVIMSDWHVTPADFYINLSYPDPAFQAIVQDVRFRKALNYGFDRYEVIDTIYSGFAGGSNLISDEYNPDKANALLDEIGMKMGSDGYRTYPDGTPFAINIDFVDRTPDMKMVGEMFVAFMQEIGIKINLKILDIQLFDQRDLANEVQCTIIWSEVIWYNQGKWQNEEIGTTYYRWWEKKGTAGDEPPENIKVLYRLTDAMGSLPPSRALEAYAAYIQNWQDNVWAIRHMSSIKQPIIANQKLKNVDIINPTWGIGLTFNGELFYFED